MGDDDIQHDDVVDQRAAVVELRRRLEAARDAEYAATVARLLAQRALSEGIARLDRLEKAARR